MAFSNTIYSRLALFRITILSIWREEDKMSAWVLSSATLFAACCGLLFVFLFASHRFLAGFKGLSSALLLFTGIFYLSKALSSIFKT